MIPPLDSPKWDAFLKNIHAYGKNTSNLATKMLLSRLNIKMQFSPSAQELQELKKMSYEFFKKNEKRVVDDIKMIFG